MQVFAWQGKKGWHLVGTMLATGVVRKGARSPPPWKLREYAYCGYVFGMFLFTVYMSMDPSPVT